MMAVLKPGDKTRVLISAWAVISHMVAGKLQRKIIPGLFME
jgi:hypothetical protein